MEVPRTPRRVGPHATSAASPYAVVDADSPRPRASTFAYGHMAPKTEFGPTPATSRGSSDQHALNTRDGLETWPHQPTKPFKSASPNPRPANQLPHQSELSSARPRAAHAPQHSVGYTAGPAASSSSTYLPDPLTPQRHLPRVSRTNSTHSPATNAPNTHSAHPSTHSAHPSTHSNTLPSVQPRRAPSRTYRHETPVPGTNENVPDQRKRQKRTSIGPWDFIRSIGAGSMGQVKLASHRYTKQLAAVKVVPKAFTQKHKDGRESNEAKDARIVREAAIGRLLSHPNIAKLYDVYAMTGHFYLVFEYINGGQMLDYIIAHGCVKENQARQFGRSIASALDYCHHNSVVHRDLKIENILIANNGDIKLIDFGLSNLFRRSDRLRTFCGSLYFAAPELLNALPYVGPEIDVWSFGVVLYVLVCGKVPFEDKSMTVLHAKIKRGSVEYPPWLSALCVDLLKRMLVVDPLERASLAEILRHPWLNAGYAGPPDAGLPRRVPLTIETLDPQVPEEMEALGIGDASSIMRSLKQVLTSIEYENALAAWHDAAVSPLGISVSPNSSRNHQMRGYESRGYESQLLPPIALRAEDPLDAFSPEISCYFLTKERMARARHELASTPSTSASTPTEPVTPGLEPPSLFAASQLNPPLEMGRARSKTVSSAYDARPPAISVSPAPPPPVGPPPQPAFVSHIHPQHSSTGTQHAQYGVMTATSSAKPINLDQTKRANDWSAEMAHTVPQRHSSTGHRYVSQPLPPTNLPTNNLPTNNLPTNNLPTNSPSPGLPGLLSPSNAAPTMSSLFRKLSLRRRGTAGHSRAKSTSQAVPVRDFDTHSRISHNSDSSQGSQPGMPSIESPKPVFFRGIFSVQTTSTKPLREIRAEIIRVLLLKQIEFVEVRGGFACVARTASSSPPPSNSAGNHESVGNGLSRHRSTHSAHANVNTNANANTNTNSNAAEYIPPQTPPRSAHRHRRMISDNGVMSPDLSLGSGSTDSIDMEIGASDMLGDHKPATSVPVRFEIDIVRVPIVSLHGVQFKKMTGNVWQYKNLAQEILELLRL